LHLGGNLFIFIDSKSNSDPSITS